MSETLGSLRGSAARSRLAWSFPLLPVAISGFLLSTMTWFRLQHGAATGNENLVQRSIVGACELFGFAPLFMVCVLVWTWSSIWFLTQRVERPIGRLLRIAAFGLCLAVLVNLRADGTLPVGGGELGAFLAARLSAALTPGFSIAVVALAAVAALLLATDFFFYSFFDGLAKTRAARAAPRRDEAVEPAAVAAFEELRLEVPEVAPRPLDPPPVAEPEPLAELAVEEPVAVDERAAEPDGASDAVELPRARARRRSRRAAWAEAGAADDGRGELAAGDEPAADDLAGAEPAPSDGVSDLGSVADGELAADDELPADGAPGIGAGPLLADEVAAEATTVADGALAPSEASEEIDGTADALAFDAADPAPEATEGAVDADDDPGLQQLEIAFGDAPAADGSATQGEARGPRRDELQFEILPVRARAEPLAVEEPADPRDEPELAAADDEPLVEIVRPEPVAGDGRAGGGEAAQSPEPSSAAAGPADDAEIEAPGPAVPAALVDEARELVVEYRRASATFLKRRLRVSDDDAMLLLQALADRGVIDCEKGASQGRVLVEP